MEKPPSTASFVASAEENAWFALLYMHAAVTAKIDAVLEREHRLSFSEFEILCRMLEREPQPVRSLAGQLVSVSPTRASRLLQDLIAAGHLRRGADQADGRISLISFTEQGRLFARAALRTFQESMQKYFVAPLEDEDIAAITRIWQRLQEAGDPDSPAEGAGRAGRN